MNVPMIVNFSKDTHDTNVPPPKIYETAWRERTICTYKETKEEVIIKENRIMKFLPYQHRGRASKANVCIENITICYMNIVLRYSWK